MRLSVGSKGECIDVTVTSPTTSGATGVIFLHGFMSHQAGEKARFFKEVLVQRGVTFVTFDFRGHGQSGGTMRELTGTRLLEDCHTVVEHVASADRRIVLIGSSMGGWVAAWSAALHPDRIAANMLIAPSFTFGRGFLDHIGPEGAAAWARDGVIRFSNEYGSVELSYELIRDMERYPVAELVRRYRTPTLIGQGMRDPIVDYRQTLAFVEQCRGEEMTLALFKDGDHRLTTYKAELAELLLSFLARWNLI